MSHSVAQILQEYSASRKQSPKLNVRITDHERHDLEACPSNACSKDEKGQTLKQTIMWISPYWLANQILTHIPQATKKSRESTTSGWSDAKLA